jgi:outer membrane biosynthesis protein TonB
MKRIASFALAVLLILSLCACSLPQAKPAKEPIDELELVEEAAEATEAEAPEETAPEASEPEALPPEETEPAAEAAAEGAETPAEVLPEEPAAPEEAPIPDAPSEVQPENAEAAEMPEPEQKAPSGNGTAPAGDTSGSSGQDSSGGSVTIPEPETGGDLVWIPTHGGTKYHRSARCSNMIDPIQVSRETAIANGFTACKRCY